MGKLIVVVGGQYGSEAKGRAVQALAEAEQAHGAGVVVMRVGGPNAGHCVYDDQSNLYKLRQLPSAVTVPNVRLLIGPGSEVNPELLRQELDQTWHLDSEDRLSVDPRATLLEKGHISAEEVDKLNDYNGSTQSGVGSARSDRIWRSAKLYGGPAPHTDEIALQALRWGGTVIVEGVQGFGLGQHAGHYPFCTTINCRAIDMLALAGISPWDAAVTSLEVWLVFRTYPIRVAGNSGPLANETSWEKLGQEPEITTVTKRQRRVGAWDPELAARAVAANGGPSQVKIWLSMIDYIDSSLYGLEGQVDPGEYSSVDLWALKVRQATGVTPSAYGTGPTTTLWASLPDWFDDESED